MMSFNVHSQFSVRSVLLVFCVFCVVFVLFILAMLLVLPMLTVFLDYLLLIAPSVFSKGFIYCILLLFVFVV